MEYFNLFAGFISGILISVISIYGNYLMKSKAETKEKILNAEYEIYLKLNELYEVYFWLATNELHKQETGLDIIKQVHSIAVDISKLIHKNQDSEFTTDLLKVLYDESYKTCNQRWKDISSLSDRMGEKLVPKYNKIVHDLNDSNILLMGTSGFKSKAPAMPRFLLQI